MKKFTYNETLAALLSGQMEMLEFSILSILIPHIDKLTTDTPAFVYDYNLICTRINGKMLAVVSFEGKKKHFFIFSSSFFFNTNNYWGALPVETQKALYRLIDTLTTKTGRIYMTREQKAVQL